MKGDLVQKELTVWNVLLQLKWVLLSVAIFLISLALVLSKAHPERKSLAKDYNYLYSVATSIKNGTEVNLPSLEEKLEVFTSLRPTFDPLFTKKYLDVEEFTKVESILKGINNRLAVKNSLVDLFSKGSLALERQDLLQAYAECKALNETSFSKEDYPFLSIYNQYRVVMLEELLDMKEEAEKSREALKAYLKGAVKEVVEKSSFLSAIQSDVTNSN